MKRNLVLLTALLLLIAIGVLLLELLYLKYRGDL